MNRSPQFKAKDLVVVTSKKSRNRGAIGVVESYCKGLYPTICQVRLSDSKVINIFDNGLKPFTA